METLEDARNAVICRLTKLADEMLRRADTAPSVVWISMQSEKDLLIELLKEFGGSWPGDGA